MNTALDETLAVLLTSLGSIKANGTPDLPPEFLIPLIHVLGPLAGSHPDAPTRHIVFRLLSITLSLTPSPTRLALLRELLSDSEALTPQMQVAAIGLVREAIIEALSATAPGQSQPNPFITPALLREIGPMVFNLQSPDMFTGGEVPLADFMESAEPLRLVESLTLLYLLLQRDTENRVRHLLCHWCDFELRICRPEFGVPRNLKLSVNVSWLLCVLRSTPGCGVGDVCYTTLTHTIFNSRIHSSHIR